MLIRDLSAGRDWTLAEGVTTVGRNPCCDVVVDCPSVSSLHAELIRRGEHLRLSDTGLSLNGTSVNGRTVPGERRLSDGDVIRIGEARLVVHAPECVPDDAVFPRRPELTRREIEVLNELVRPALRAEPFVEPATAAQVARVLVVTEAAVKQHLLRLYGKFGIRPGPDRRARLANTALACGAAWPLPTP